MGDYDIRTLAVRTLGDRAYQMADLLAWSRGKPEAETQDLLRVWRLPSYRRMRREIWNMPVKVLREKINASRSARTI